MACVQAAAEAPRTESRGYIVYPLPISTYMDKHRVITLFRLPLVIAVNAKVCKFGLPLTPTVWIKLDVKDVGKKKKTVIVGRLYREWGGSAYSRKDVIESLGVLLMAARSTAHHIALLGNFNLDRLRSEESSFCHRPLLAIHNDAIEVAGLKYLLTVANFRSHGSFQSRSGPSSPSPGLQPHGGLEHRGKGSAPTQDGQA